jgi:hypothetical protein
MEKSWLIRTQNNHLLGPVSLKKIRELLEKGSLKSEDEISCGNGYWFFIREEELISKYINNEIPQGFNPVSEADSVLTAVTVEDEKECIIPEEEDLEYPDDVTQVGSKEDILAQLKRETIVPEENDKEESFEDNPRSVKLPTKPNIEHKVKSIHRSSKKSQAKKSFLNQNLLLIAIGILFLFALAGFYFRKQLIKEFIEANIQIHLVSPSYAQVIPESVKKKLII